MKVYLENPIRPKASTALTLAELLLDSTTGDSAEVTVEWWNAVEEAKEGLAEHLDAVLQLRTAMLTTINSIDDEIARLKELKAERVSKADRLQSAIKYYMDMTGTREIVTDLATLRIKKNPPRLEIEDEAVIPAEYRREEIVMKIDKQEIKRTIREGIMVEGCRLIQDERLEIK